MLYMPESTVKAAKLYNKSADELRSMGVGRDEHGFYLLAQVSVPVPKTGVLTTVRAVLNVAKTAVDIVATRLGEKASPAAIAKREEICRTCFEVDGSGRRLFRFYGVDRVSCGQPMDPTASGSKVLRDPVVDGCGCWLNDKWLGAAQACPRGKWGPEPVKLTAQSKKKGRCCGGNS